MSLRLTHDEVARLYTDEELTLKEIASRAGVTHQRISQILHKAGVKGKRGRKHRINDAKVEEIRRLFEDEGMSVTKIARLLNHSSGRISTILKGLGYVIKRGSPGSKIFPQLRELKVGESVELPRIHSDSHPKWTYVRYYMMAKDAGIRVSVRVTSDSKVKVTRKG